MGLVYNDYLSCSKIYACKACKTHLSDHDSILSRTFRGQLGKAFLFADVVNTVSGAALHRQMTTGKHLVRDISCRQCGVAVGWKYDRAFEAAEKYKEGKYVLEAALLCLVT
ncbi:MAG: hypothetical protein M1829_006005 [Trizodia sp. TS-e1964]|nr:MAG: hypothetical protein M1829_006005 [Trizodia sp. TS-e1964]